VSDSHRAVNYMGTMLVHMGMRAAGERNTLRCDLMKAHKMFILLGSSQIT